MAVRECQIFRFIFFNAGGCPPARQFHHADYLTPRRWQPVEGLLDAALEQSVDDPRAAASILAGGQVSTRLTDREQ